MHRTRTSSCRDCVKIPFDHIRFGTSTSILISLRYHSPAEPWLVVRAELGLYKQWIKTFARLELKLIKKKKKDFTKLPLISACPECYPTVVNKLRQWQNINLTNHSQKITKKWHITSWLTKCCTRESFLFKKILAIFSHLVNLTSNTFFQPVFCANI